MKFALLITLLATCYGISTEHMVTERNCEAATSVKVLLFQDIRCNTSKLNENPILLNYIIYMEHRGATRFPGFICSRWAYKKLSNTTFSTRNSLYQEQLQWILRLKIGGLWPLERIARVHP